MVPSWAQILIVVVLVILLFGRGKISDLMGDLAKGIKSFRKGLADSDIEQPEAKESSKLAEKREIESDSSNG
ncbi:MAG: twin-arginine translocase TatA/TatE family subunit [Parvularculales bacterium]